MAAEGVNQTDLRVEVPDSAVAKRAIAANVESNKPEEKPALPVELEKIAENVEIEKYEPKKADSIQHPVSDPQVVTSETQKEETSPQLKKFQDLVIGQLSEEDKLSRREFLYPPTVVITESLAYKLIFDYWLARKELGSVSKSQFFNSDKVNNDCLDFKLRHLKSLTWDGWVKDKNNTPKSGWVDDMAGKNFRSYLRAFLESHVDNAVHIDASEFNLYFASQIGLLLFKGREFYKNFTH